MKLELFIGDTRGHSLLEFTITLPLFLSLAFGLVQVGLLMWIWVGMQHGVEMAARCAAASDSAIEAGLNPATTRTNCYNVNGSATANLAAIQSYAATNSWGVNPPPSIFSVSTTSASCPGSILVSVNNYNVNLINYLLSVNLNAQSCYTTAN